MPVHPIAELNCLNSVDCNHTMNKLVDTAHLKTANFSDIRADLLLPTRSWLPTRSSADSFRQEGFQQEGLWTTRARRRTSSLFLSRAFGSHHLQQGPTSTRTSFNDNDNNNNHVIKRLITLQHRFVTSWLHQFVGIFRLRWFFRLKWFFWFFQLKWFFQ